MTRVQGKELLNFWVQGTVTGSVDGSNVTFTVADVPKESAVLQFFLNGILQTQGVDYTFSGTTITCTTAPALAQEPQVYYVRNQGE